MVDPERDPRQRDPLAIYIERGLNRIHASRGYWDTANQIAALLREQIPETAQRIARVDEQERLIQRLEDENRALGAFDYRLIMRQSELLRGVAAALKGPPGPLMMHDHSDLPKVAADLVAELADVKEMAEKWVQYSQDNNASSTDRALGIAAAEVLEIFEAGHG